MAASSWNKGFTKETHPSVMKISRTMRRKGIDNFKRWRDRMRHLGKIPASYSPFLPSGDFAEYIGVVLGDGNISEFPRAERIIISGNSKNKGFVRRYALLTRRLFRKRPTISKVWNKNNIRISLYQKEISKRLGIPAGNRQNASIRVPKWIWDNERYVIRLLRGLFEAEGSLSIHQLTYSYNLEFSNRNSSLLQIVGRGLKTLGYHPEFRTTSTRLRKKHEVEKFLKQVRFRAY